MEIENSDFQLVSRKKRKIPAAPTVRSGNTSATEEKKPKKASSEKYVIPAKKPTGLAQNATTSVAKDRTSFPVLERGVAFQATRASNAQAPKHLHELDKVDGIDSFKCKPPPIMLKIKAGWGAISQALTELKVVIVKATTVHDGIRIQVQSPACYRATTKLFNSRNLNYFTYRLNEEREIKVVIRGVHEAVQDEQIISELIEKHQFPVISVRRMGNRSRAFPMVAVHLSKTEAARKIYNLTRLCHLSVSVETLKPNPRDIQCHRCQGFGHGSLRCNISPRCVKCAGEHLTSECVRNKDVDGAPKCANCAGEHTASYKGCGCFPKRKYSQVASFKAASPPKPAVAQDARPQIGADIASAVQTIASPEFAAMLAQIKSILPALATLQKLNLA